eukprot:scaffold12243_cov59-Phaeocystis_antarctica.AAC.2
MARVDVDGEPPGRSAELQAPPEPRRRPHLRPREPPSATARLQAALAPPSVYPLMPRDAQHSGLFLEGRVYVPWRSPPCRNCVYTIPSGWEEYHGS